MITNRDSCLQKKKKKKTSQGPINVQRSLVMDWLYPEAEHNAPRDELESTKHTET